MFEQFSDIKRDEPLSKHCWYALGGPADYFAEAKNSDEIVALVDEAKKSNIPYMILGSGSNTVFHDEGFRGLVIKVVAQDLKFEEDESGQVTGRIFADAGVQTTQLVKEAMERDLTGIESLFGLPGTIGGAVFGNAEAHGTSTGDFVEQVTLLDAAGNVKKVGREYFDFSYRHSKLHETGEIVLKVVLKLEKLVSEEQRSKAKEALDFRKEKQPSGRNNGSFFKNPEDDYAGRLIDVAGLKGAKIGGAYISEKHGNFFMNDGTAKTADLIALRDLAKKTVYEKFGVELKEEVRIVLPDGTYLNDS